MLESFASFPFNTKVKVIMSVPLHHTVMHGALPKLILMGILCLAHGDIVVQVV